MTVDTKKYLIFLIRSLGHQNIVKTLLLGLVVGVLDLLFLISIWLMSTLVISNNIPSSISSSLARIGLPLNSSGESMITLALFLFFLSGIFSAMGQILLIRNTTGTAFATAENLVKKIFMKSAQSFGRVDKLTLQNIQSDIVNRLLPGVFIPAIGIIGRTGGMICVCLAGFYAQPATGLLLVALGVFLFWIKSLLNKKLRSLGDDGFTLHRLKENFLNTGSAYVAADRTSSFRIIKRFNESIERFFKTEKIYSIVNQSEKTIVELLLLLLIVVFGGVALSLSVDRSAVFAVLVSLAVVSYRTLPILTNIAYLKNSSVYFFSSYSEIQSYMAALSFDRYHFETSRALILIESVVFQVSNTSSVGPFSFEVEEYDKLLITGPSGSGKTSLANMMVGRLQPSHGRIGLAPQAKIGSLPQFVPILPCSLSENILLVNGQPNREMYDEILDQLDLRRLIDIHGDRDALEIGLSGGEVQRIGIARLLLDGSDLVILDEPTSALNSALARKVLDLVCEVKNTVVIISHDRTVLGHHVFTKRYDLEPQNYDISPNL